MSRERHDYVEEHPKEALTSRPSLARWEIGNSHGWILQEQQMPYRLGKKIITRVPLTAAFLKYMRCLCCLLFTFLFHLSMDEKYDLPSGAVPHQGNKPKAGELLLL